VAVHLIESGHIKPSLTLVAVGALSQAIDEDDPWDETDPMFYEMHDEAMDF